MPPRVPRISTQAVFKPSCPALMAATYPPGPPPTTTTSYCWSVVEVDEKKAAADALCLVVAAPRRRWLPTRPMEALDNMFINLYEVR